jgi:nitrogen fixation/metabolism regulation signal transduction histidine kinase
LTRRWLPLVIGAGVVTWVVALALLAVTTRDSQEFGRLQPWILVINVAGVMVLLALLAGRLGELIRERRQQVPGSRLRTRSVAMLSVLVLVPLLVVFTFSVLFLTRGIDSWFHAEVRQGLTDALGLSRAALDLRMREYLDRTVQIAHDLEGRHSAALFSELDEARRSNDADELAVVSAGGRLEAYSAAASCCRSAGASPTSVSTRPPTTDTSSAPPSGWGRSPACRAGASWLPFIRYHSGWPTWRRRCRGLTSSTAGCPTCANR